MESDSPFGYVEITTPNLPKVDSPEKSEHGGFTWCNECVYCVRDGFGYTCCKFPKHLYKGEPGKDPSQHFKRGFFCGVGLSKSLYKKLTGKEFVWP